MEPVNRLEARHTLLVGAGVPRFAAKWPNYFLPRIHQHGRWASWWSFPLRTDAEAALREWPYLYVYFGAEYRKLLFRQHVIGHKTQPGNAGIKSPWPEVTDEEERERTIAKRDTEWYLPDVGVLPRIFKTWFLFDSFEELTPPIPLDELERLDGQPAKPLRSGFALWRLKS